MSVQPVVSLLGDLVGQGLVLFEDTSASRTQELEFKGRVTITDSRDPTQQASDTFVGTVRYTLPPPPAPAPMN